MVVDKLMVELQSQLSEKKVKVSLTQAARRWLAREGYDPAFGARPLRRLIMKENGDRLTEEILFGSLIKGGEVKVGNRHGKMTFSFPKK